MLILTRRITEVLRIGKNYEIEIGVIGIKGNQVRLGIDAPSDIPVHRQEIYERIMRDSGKESEIIYPYYIRKPLERGENNE